MPYIETKVYFDGSHYIAIPHTEKPNNRNAKSKVNVSETNLTEAQSNDKKELFNKLYKEHSNGSRKERKEKITEELEPHFNDKSECEYFVQENMERKRRNLIYRRVRMFRKANLADFNYFCTFTYDDNLHDEQSFRKSLSKTFHNFASRKSWKYIGVWERSPLKLRLHFHGLFHIPENTLPGEFTERNDYSFNEHKRKTTVENSYFKERFGRNDFVCTSNTQFLGEALAYLMKYIEKSGEKIVYSRNLPQYFISDIMDEDIADRIGVDDRKLLLFDDFSCWDNGEYVGIVSEETIRKLRKVN